MSKKISEVKKILLSLNLVVSGYEKNIREFLKIMDGVFDEIVIINTGSEGSMADLVKDFGVNIISLKWEDDFSKLRNAAKENSMGEWIFFLESKESITKDDGLKIRSIVKEPNSFDGFLFQVTTKIENKIIESIEMIRLFRNKTEYKFHGRCFEQIGPSIIKNGGKIKRVKEIKILNILCNIENIQEILKRDFGLLKKQVEDEPEDPYMLTQLAWTAYQSSDKVYAKKIAEKVLKINDTPQTFIFRIFLLLGKIYLDDKDFPKSEEFFKEAMSIDPESRELSFLIGLLQREKGDNINAIMLFEKALHFPVKLSYHARDIKLSDSDILYNIALSFLYLGENEKAIDSLESITKVEFHIPSFVLLSEIFTKQSEYQKALENLLKAKEIEPDNTDISTKMGNIYFQTGDYEKAEKAYNDAANTGSDSSEIYNNIASTFAARGQNDKAEAFYKKSVKKNPKFHDGYKNLGYLYMREKKYDKAIINFEKAFKLKPIMRESGDRLGEIYYINGDFKNSYRIYKNLLNLFPGDPRLYNNLGVCALNLEKTKEALKHFTTALELYPDYKDARENLDSILKETEG
jgi:tetratricopeptide (TPR) repeat protein